MAKYREDRIEVVLVESAAATWTFAGKTVKGIDFRYDLKDGNFRSRNRWQFAVRVPVDPYDRIEVRPIKTPNDKAYAGLDRRSLTFMRATLGTHTKSRYCQIALALPEGDRTRDVVNRDQKKKLPSWMLKVAGSMRRKATVRNTKGTDGESLVALVASQDHDHMIAMFMATKAWVRKSGFRLD